MALPTTPITSPFNYAQTFFIDPARVNGADVVYVTSVNLFFKRKPDSTYSSQLRPDPGVSVSICPVSDSTPDLASYNRSNIAYKPASSITSSTSSLVANKFNFARPFVLNTGRRYAIVIGFDGNEPFDLWTSIAGDVDLVRGNRVSNDSGYIDGFFYQITNGRDLTALRGTDLTFEVNVAKFSDLDVSYTVVNDDYEFLTVDQTTQTGTFLGGELLYQETSNSTGTVSAVKGSTSLTGNGTYFVADYNVNDVIILQSGTDRAALFINSIASNTSLTLKGSIPFTNTVATHMNAVTAMLMDYDSFNSTMVLNKSTAANSAFKFTAGETLIGVDSHASIDITSVDDQATMVYKPTHTIATPAKTSVTLSPVFANTSYNYNAANIFDVENGKTKILDSYPAIVASRSNEVTNSTNLQANTAKSVSETIHMVSENSYASPMVPLSGMVFDTYGPDINNDSTNEHKNYGNARSKYVSKRFDLTDAQSAEDLRVFLTAYRPGGTTIEVYAKLYNPLDGDTFEAKDWTKLELTSVANNSVYSDISNRGDTVNLEYAIPGYHSGTTANGTFTTTLSSSLVTGTSGAVNTAIAVGDVVRIYNPLIPENYCITTVTASNTTTFSISGDSPSTTTIANSSLVSTGMKVDVVSTYKNSAFVDPQNYNIVRYYNSAGAVLTTYRTFAIKIVLLAEKDYVAPVVFDMRAIALSA